MRFEVWPLCKYILDTDIIRYRYIYIYPASGKTPNRMISKVKYDKIQRIVEFQVLHLDTEYIFKFKFKT